MQLDVESVTAREAQYEKRGQMSPLRIDRRKGLMNTSLGTAITILALSLAAWVFFYVTSEPLKPSETTVVVGFIALLVVSVKWLWTRRRKPQKENRP